VTSSSTRDARESAQGPVPAGFNHMSIPVKDVGQAVRFFTEALGAEEVFVREGFGEVRCGGVVIGFSKQSGGWTAHDAEYPHYGLLVDADDMWPLKERLESHGVPTHDIWTRDGSTGLMYFRDPSGNLFELYCPRVRDEDAPRMIHQGQTGFKPPLAALNHDWKG